MRGTTLGDRRVRFGFGTAEPAAVVDVVAGRAAVASVPGRAAVAAVAARAAVAAVAARSAVASVAGRAAVAAVAARAAVASVAAVAAGFLFVQVYPQLAPYFPKCVFHEVSGLHCTGCGSTRTVYALLSGDFAAAWAQNPLLVAVLPWLGWKVFGRALRLFGASWPVRGIELPGKWHWLFAALVIAFTVLRNLPGGEFLGPRE